MTDASGGDLERMNEMLNKQKDKLEGTLEAGLKALCEAVDVDSEMYDRDQADAECYMDCFKDIAKALKKFSIVYDGLSGEFVRTSLKPKAGGV